MQKGIYFDIRRDIEQKNLINLDKLQCKYKSKIKLLKKIFQTGDLKAYYIDGLVRKRKLYQAILVLHSQNAFTGVTDGGIKIHAPTTVQIFLLKKIRDMAVTPEGLTRDEVVFIIRERKKPKRKRGDYNTGDYFKSVNWIASYLKISNRRVAEFCRRKHI